jgi:hypothetical protein
MAGEIKLVASSKSKIGHGSSRTGLPVASFESRHPHQTKNPANGWVFSFGMMSRPKLVAF